MAADQENTKLMVTFKPRVFSLGCDLKTSDMVTNSNPSFVCPPDSASLHNLRIRPRCAPAADIYIGNIYKGKNDTVIISVSIF